MYNSPLFLYTSNEQLKTEIEKCTISVAPKSIQSLDIKQTKYVQVLYTENYKTKKT